MYKVFNCYQCDKVAFLFADSRCKDCTRMNSDGSFDNGEDDVFDETQ